MRNGHVKAFSLGLVAGSFLTAGTLYFAAPAKATPDADVAAVYNAICDTLDAYPTFGGVLGVGEALIQEGLTARQAGHAIFKAAVNSCPWQLGLLRNFATTYGGTSDSTAIA